jgi:hypothetical protein
MLMASFLLLAAREKLAYRRRVLMVSIKANKQWRVWEETSPSNNHHSLNANEAGRKNYEASLEYGWHN